MDDHDGRAHDGTSHDGHGRRGSPAQRRCQVDDCERKHYAGGWCALHYKRWLRTGSGIEPQPPSSCSVANCARPATSRGWCHGHYQRWRRDGDVDPATPLGRRRQADRCGIQGCQAASHSHGLCRTHASRRTTLSDPLPDIPIGEMPRRQGPTGKAKGWTTAGYRYVPVDPAERHLTGGAAYAAEHRLTMARHLGRALEKDENVHHRDGDRQNNTLENLELWSTAQPSGQRRADKVRFAMRVLRRYAPELLANPAADDDQTAEAPGRYVREPLLRR